MPPKGKKKGQDTSQRRLTVSKAAAASGEEGTTTAAQDAAALAAEEKASAQKKKARRSAESEEMTDTATAADTDAATTATATATTAVAVRDALIAALRAKNSKVPWAKYFAGDPETENVEQPKDPSLMILSMNSDGCNCFLRSVAVGTSRALTRVETMIILAHIGKIHYGLLVRQVTKGGRTEVTWTFSGAEFQEVNRLMGFKVPETVRGTETISDSPEDAAAAGATAAVREPGAAGGDATATAAAAGGKQAASGQAGEAKGADGEDQKSAEEEDGAGANAAAAAAAEGGVAGAAIAAQGGVAGAAIAGAAVSPPPLPKAIFFHSSVSCPCRTHTRRRYQLLLVSWTDSSFCLW
jgi:hypothetical protein